MCRLPRLQAMSAVQGGGEGSAKESLGGGMIVDRGCRAEGASPVKARVIIAYTAIFFGDGIQNMIALL